MLSDQSIKDTVLFREVTAASKREKEYQEMHEEQQEVQVNSTNTKNNKKKTASAAAMDATVDDKTSLAILQQLEKLATSNEQLCAQMKKREDEMSNMKNELEQFKKRFGSNRGPPSVQFVKSVVLGVFTVHIVERTVIRSRIVLKKTSRRWC